MTLPAEATPPKRRLFVALFAVGALLALAFGCLVASYDLWGGVPRAMWPATRFLLIGSVICVITGGVGWIRSWPTGERLGKALRAAAALAVLAALGGAALWFHYVSRWQSSRLVCSPALIAPTRAARDAAIREGLGPLFPVIDPHSSCLTLLRERQALESTGECPTFVMNDVSCRCGKEKWTAGDAPRCATGPTACQYREKETSLGCAEYGSQYILEEARRAETNR